MDKKRKRKGNEMETAEPSEKFLKVEHDDPASPTILVRLEIERDAFDAFKTLCKSRGLVQHKALSALLRSFVLEPQSVQCVRLGLIHGRAAKASMEEFFEAIKAGRVTFPEPPAPSAGQ